MNHDDIIRMAEEAGLVQIIAVHDDGTRTMQLPHPNLLANFATLVAEQERQACARVVMSFKNWSHVDLLPISEAIKSRRLDIGGQA
jgi:hypothetical protein